MCRHQNQHTVPQMEISIFERVEKIAGKGENAGYKHIPLFPQYFQKHSFVNFGTDNITKQLIFLQFSKQTFEKVEKKEKNSGCEYFFLLPINVCYPLNTFSYKPDF